MNELAMYLQGKIGELVPEYATQVLDYSAFSARFAIFVCAIVVLILWTVFALIHNSSKVAHNEAQKWLYKEERRPYSMSEVLSGYLVVCACVTILAGVIVFFAIDLLIEINLAPMAVVIDSIR